jgi:hypothetical protein
VYNIQPKINGGWQKKNPVVNRDLYGLMMISVAFVSDVLTMAHVVIILTKSTDP